MGPIGGVHVTGLSEEQLKRLELLAEGYVIEILTQVANRYAALLEQDLPEPEPLTAAADLSGMADEANAALNATVRPLVGEIYLSGRGAIRAQIVDRAGIQLPPVSSIEAENYLRSVGPIFDEIGADLWTVTQSELADGYAAGESIPQLAQRVRGAARKSVKTSTLVARSAVVSAANKGTMDMARAAGIDMAKEWMATPDSRTRPTHNIADGQYVPIDEQFVVGGYKCDYPGEWSLPPQERYNCRCTVGFVIPDEIQESAAPVSRPRPPRPVGAARDDRTDEWGTAADPASKMLVRDLRQIAKDAKVPGAATANKRDLIYNIRYYESVQRRSLLPPLPDRLPAAGAPVATIAPPPSALSGGIADVRLRLTVDTPDGVPIRDVTVEGYTIPQGRAYRIDGITYVVETAGDPLDTTQAALAKIVVEDLRRAHATLPDGQYNDTYAWILGRNPQDQHWAVEYGIPGFRSEATAWDGALTLWDREFDTKISIATIRHETGHNVDSQAQRLGIGSDSPAWEAAATQDAAGVANRVADFRSGPDREVLVTPPDFDEQWPAGVTAYGRVDRAEDYAEAFNLYVSGSIGEGEISGVRGAVFFRDLFPERAALFDRQFPEFGAVQRAEIARLRRALEVEQAKKLDTAVAREIAEREARLKSAQAIVDIDTAISGNSDIAAVMRLLEAHASTLKLKPAERKAFRLALEAGDAAKIDVALRKLAKARGIELGPPVGRRVPATATMRQQGAEPLAIGSDVRVTGRGAITRINGNDIPLIQTRVAPLTPEDLARARRVAETEATKLADFLVAARREIATGPATAATRIGRLAARAGLKPAEEVALLRDRSPDGLARALASLQRTRKLKAMGTRGRAAEFDPDSMDAGGAVIEPGARVKITDPGYSIEIDGQPVIVRKTAVQAAAGRGRRGVDTAADADDAIIADAEAEIARVRGIADDYRARGADIPEDILNANLLAENQARARLAGARARKLADEPRAIDDPEQSARQQQARFDVARQHAAMLAELDELRENGASIPVMVSRLRIRAAAVGARQDVVDELIDAAQTGDRAKIDAAISTVAQRAKVRRSTGAAGEIERFDARKHQPIAGERIGSGARVKVVRPGYRVRNDDGDWVNIERAVVESADEAPAVELPDVAPARMRFDDPVELGYESLGDDELRELARSFLARPPGPESTRAEFLAALRTAGPNIEREVRRIRAFRLNKAESLESILGEADELAGKLAAPDVAERAVRAAYGSLISEQGAWVPPAEFLEDVLVALRAGGLPAVKSALREVGERYGLRVDLSYGDVISGERFRELYGVADRIDRSAFEDLENYVVVRRPAVVDIAGERTVVGRAALRRASEREVESGGKSRRVAAKAPTPEARTRALTAIRKHDADVDRRVLAALTSDSRSLGDVYADLAKMPRSDFQLAMLRLAGRTDVDLEIVDDVARLRGAAREAAVRVPGQDRWIAAARIADRGAPGPSRPLPRAIGEAIEGRAAGRAVPAQVSMTGRGVESSTWRVESVSGVSGKIGKKITDALTAYVRRPGSLNHRLRFRDDPRYPLHQQTIGELTGRELPDPDVVADAAKRSDRLIAGMDELMERSELSDPIVVWRGASGDDATRWLRASVGDEIEDLGFVSTSPVRKVAEDSFAGDVLLQIRAPAGTRGVSIGGIDDVEILLDRGLTMRVLSIRDAGAGKRKIVEVEVLPKVPEINLDSLKVGDLRALAAQRGVDVPAKATKQQLLTVLRGGKLPEAPAPTTKAYTSMKVDELRALAAQRGVEVPAKAPKARLVKALQDADAPQPAKQAGQLAEGAPKDVVSVRRVPAEQARALREARSRFAAASKEARKGRDAIASVPLRINDSGDDEVFEGFEVLDAVDRQRVQASLVSYTRSGFEDVNTWLRTGLPKAKGPFPKTEPEIKQMLADMLQAFDRSRLPEPVTVYRGVGTGRGLFGPRDSWPEDLSGFEWVDRAMFSSSADRSVAEDFGDVQLRIIVPKGNRALALSSVGRAREAEILLPPGMRFRVVRDRGVVDGKRRLDVEVVPENPPVAPEAPTSEFASKTVGELRAIATERGLDLPVRATRAQLLRALDETPAVDVAAGWRGRSAALRALDTSDAALADAQVRPLGGSVGQTRLVTLPDGQQFVRKNYKSSWRDKADIRHMTDAEDLGAAVLDAVGVRAPAVAVRPGTLDIDMEFLDGGTTLEERMFYDGLIYDQTVESPEGRLVGIADYLMANTDRNAGNILLRAEGRLAGIDHGYGFQYDSRSIGSGLLVQGGSEFASDLLESLTRRGALREVVDINPADLAIMRKRLQALLPLFVQRGRAAWHKTLMRRLAALEKRADPLAPVRLAT